MNHAVKIILFHSLFCWIAPLQSQSIEALENKIAQAYRDSLTKNIPYLYDKDEYYQVETKWDQKIFSLENEDIISYLKLKKKWRPIWPELTSDLFLPIALKALQGSEFHLSLYGKGIRHTNVRPIVIELSNAICNCWTEKAKNPSDPEILTAQESEEALLLQTCFKEQSAIFRPKVLQDFNLTDPVSIKIFSHATTGYIVSNCPSIVAGRATTKASSWVFNLNDEIDNALGRAARDIIDAARQEITDTLANQFVSIEHFNKAKLALLNLEKLFNQRPKASYLIRKEDLIQKKNQVFQKFTFWEDKKVISQLIIEYDADPYGKIRSAIWVPREKIKNLTQLTKVIETMPPPIPDDLPPPPIEYIPKHE